MWKWCVPVVALMGAGIVAVWIRLPAPPLTGEDGLRAMHEAPAQRVLPATTPAGVQRVVAVLDVPTASRRSAARLRGGGFDIDTRLHTPSNSQRTPGLELRRLGDGVRTRVAVPGTAWILDARFTADGRRLAIDVVEGDRVALWLVNPQTGAVEATVHAPFSFVWGDACDWQHSADRVLCRLATASSRPAARRTVDAEPAASPGDPDCLDGAAFDREFSVQLAFVNLGSGLVEPVGRPGTYDVVELAPGGGFILIGRAVHETTTGVRLQDLVRELEVWTADGTVRRRLPGRNRTASRRPPASWDPAKPSRLVWCSKGTSQPTGESVMELDAPFTGEPAQVFAATGAIWHLSWGGNGALFVTEEDATRARVRTWIVGDRTEPRIVWDNPKEPSPTK
jgi:dipeptidyl aminopeptidase/acylaminoacyl peptidase